MAKGPGYLPFCKFSFQRDKILHFQPGGKKNPTPKNPQKTMISSGMRNSSGDRCLALSCQPNERRAYFEEPQRDLGFGWSPVDDRLLTRALSNQLSLKELFHFNQTCPYARPFCVGFLPVDVLFAVGRELRKDGKNCLPGMLSLNVYSGNCLFGRNLEKL